MAKEGINICNLLDNLSSLDEEGDALKNNSVNTSSKKDEKIKNSKKMSESKMINLLHSEVYLQK